MQNPFTTTFSKTPEYTYIDTAQSREIIENFSYSEPSESVYKITGVRGSGKTVILAKVEERLKSEEFEKMGWLVYRLSPSRDMLRQFASYLSKESFAKEEPRSKSFSLSATVLGTGGGVGFSTEKDDSFFDIGSEIDLMLEKAAEKGRKILIGIDEVSRTREMVIFASEFGKWLRAGYPVYLVCTGLYENIQELANVKNLTFFRRATTVKTGALSTVAMSEIYHNKLGVSYETARHMADITRGYAYAFQELGVLYFRKQSEEALEDIVEELQIELFSYSYEKIWEELSDNDRLFMSLLTGKNEYKREEVLALLDAKSNIYSVYRDRMLKRGLITARGPYIGLSLPYFSDYIQRYC